MTVRAGRWLSVCAQKGSGPPSTCSLIPCLLDSFTTQLSDPDVHEIKNLTLKGIETKNL